MGRTARASPASPSWTATASSCLARSSLASGRRRRLPVARRSDEVMRWRRVQLGGEEDGGPVWELAVVYRRSLLIFSLDTNPAKSPRSESMVCGHLLPEVFTI